MAMVAWFVAPCTCSLIPIPFSVFGGWVVAFYQKRQRKAARLPKMPLIVGGVAGVFLAAGTAVYIQKEMFRVRVAHAEWPNYNEADLNYRNLQRASAEWLTFIKQKRPEAVLSTSISLIERNGRRLGVIRLQEGGVTPALAVYGISRSKLTRVVCSIAAQSDVNARSPECNHALQSSFGTALEP